MNYIKIVCTIGPNTINPPILRSLYETGMDMVRLNGSHSSIQWHSETIDTIRRIIPDVPILVDLPGRKIRLGVLKQDICVKLGDTIILTPDPNSKERDVLPITYSRLSEDVHQGDIITIDDSTVRFLITEISGQDVICKVHNEGVVQSRKGVHIPGKKTRVDFLSDRDRLLIELSCHKQVDFLGVSFVETGQEVESIRGMIGNNGCRIVSKIETQLGLEHLQDIASRSDALMIDRGDLSAETNIESIAILQKHIIGEAKRLALPVIIATEMLNTMIENPLPTKAEICDISNAVLDGASALMLSAETAVGKYPIEAVIMMRRVADRALQHQQESLSQNPIGSDSDVPRVIGEAIAMICRNLHITKIVAITKSGYAARMIAAKQPSQPILAVTNNPLAARQFNLNYGTKGIWIDVPFSRTSMDHVPLCLQTLWRQGEIVEEDLILVTAVSYPRSGNRMNIIELHKVADLRESLGWLI